MAIKQGGVTVIDDSRNITGKLGLRTKDAILPKYNYSLTQGGLLNTLNNPNAYSNSVNDSFGYSVAVDGDYIIVGAYQEDDTGGANSGKAYIFNVTTGQLLWTLNNPNAYGTSAVDQFGWSVAISGNYAIVGANTEDDAGGLDSGKAYIFNVTTGNLVWTLNNPNVYSTSAGDQFGQSVAISGNYAIVGAYQEADASGTFSGKAYIFNVTTGTLLWTLNNPNPYSTSASDNFGWSVAISGNYAIVSEPGEDDAGGTQSGKAYIYNVTTGALVWTLNNPNVYSTSATDSFGSVVAISGNYAIVSAPGEDDAGGTQSGKAYIFNVTTGALVYTLNNPNAYSTSATDNFGVRVGISGNYALIGASLEADAGGTSSGKAYIFNVTTGALVYTLNNPNAYSTSASDNFGVSVAISGNYAIVGAYNEDDASGTSSGKAYIFSLDYALQQTQNNYSVTSGYSAYIEAIPGQFKYTLNNPNAFSGSTNDNFGASVAISGNYAIVGANLEDDAGGADSGKAYIFNVTTGQLVWTLNNPNAYSTSASDQFGYAVAISGNYAAVSAINEDDANSTGLAVGRVYIFNVTTGNLIWTITNPNAYSTNTNDAFGFVVKATGKYLIVGAQGEDDISGGGSGVVYVFDITTSNLLYTLYDANTYSTPTGDSFGNAIAVTETGYLVVGAIGEYYASVGAAYVYNLTTGALLWTLNNPNAYGTPLFDYFGSRVDISKDYVVVSTASEDDAGGTDSGAAYVFSTSTGQLVRTFTNPNPYSTSASDTFGVSIKIVNDYLFVGAQGEDSSLGLGTGVVYCFNIKNGSLLYTISNPNAYSTVTSDQFGFCSDASGNYIIIGTPFEDDPNGTSSGKVYVFTLEGYQKQAVSTSAKDLGYVQKSVGGTLKWTLDNPNAYSTSADDRFGYSVSIDGNYAIVSSLNEDDAGGADSGKAYIFNVTTGNLVWTLNNPNAYSTSTNDSFGQLVAISGNYAIVGAHNEDDTGGLSSGKAYIFNVTTGQLVWTLNNPNAYSTSANDYFGISVAISGNYAIVGAYNEDDTGGADSGKAYIFNVTTGQLVWTLNNPNAYSTSVNDQFGLSVAISGNYAIVATPFEADAGGALSGKAYIFNVTTGQLVWTLNNPNAYSTSANDYFGISVAISGNYAIVGAYAEDDTGGALSGKAYIFNVTTGNLVWTLNNPNAYSTSASDQFGRRISISGNYAIVSAWGEDDSSGTESGKAYIFNVTTGQLVWTLNNPNAYSTSANDYFGYSVSISGNYAIVGAYWEDDTGGALSGKAYIFAVNDTFALTNVEKITFANGFELSADNKLLQKSLSLGSLVHILDDPNAYSTPGSDLFGSMVSLSGNYAAIGAYGESDAGGSASGKAYIFNTTTGQLLWTLNNPNAYSTSASDNFSKFALSASSKYTLVGAYAEDDAGGSQSGAAYVFSNSTGQLLYTFINPNAYSTSDLDSFGISVAASDSYFAVGASGEDDAGGASSGKVYIYKASTGALLFTLNNPTVYSTSTNDQFGGYGLSISGNYLAVGVPYEYNQAGCVYIFDLSNGQLIRTIIDPNTIEPVDLFDWFGFKVHLNGRKLVTSAYYESLGGTASGSIYVHDIITGQLIVGIGDPNLFDVASYDSFGESVAINSNYIAASSMYEYGGEGVVYIFDYSGKLINKLTRPHPNVGNTVDYFGNSISMDENYILVGAWYEDDANATTSGKAYIFSARDFTYLDRLMQLV